MSVFSLLVAGIFVLVGFTAAWDKGNVPEVLPDEIDGENRCEACLNVVPQVISNLRGVRDPYQAMLDSCDRLGVGAAHCLKVVEASGIRFAKCVSVMRDARLCCERAKMCDAPQQQEAAKRNDTENSDPTLVLDNCNGNCGFVPTNITVSPAPMPGVNSTVRVRGNFRERYKAGDFRCLTFLKANKEWTRVSQSRENPTCLSFFDCPVEAGLGTQDFPLLLPEDTPQGVYNVRCKVATEDKILFADFNFHFEIS